MNNEEVWKPIPGYENRYMVSSKGNLYSLTRNKRMTPRLNKDGYLRTRLFDGVKKNDFTVHRLVAMAFIPNPDNLPMVNHKDENKTNNAVENLEWCTGTYNVNYGTGNMRNTIARSKPILQTDLEGNPIAIYMTSFSLRNAGYKRENVQTCARGITQTAYGYKWRFLETKDVSEEVMNESLHLKAGIQSSLPTSIGR